MRNLVYGFLAFWGIASAVACAAASDPTTDEQKTLYALGLMISQTLGSFALSESELEFVKAGLTDGVLKRPPKVELQTYGPKVQQMRQARAAVIAESEKRAGAAFLDKAAMESGAIKTASGLVIKTLKPGSGPSPKATDTVKVHYHGTLIDGTVFDSSVQRGQPVTFSLSNVIPCWTEGLQRMQVGGKSRLVCPSNLAYGGQGGPPLIKPGATLVFEVELLDLVK
jgi:FKBP-type peptidyl-prolyl cis-trans isomerase FkpA